MMPRPTSTASRPTITKTDRPNDGTTSRRAAPSALGGPWAHQHLQHACDDQDGPAEDEHRQVHLDDSSISA